MPVFNKLRPLILVNDLGARLARLKTSCRRPDMNNEPISEEERQKDRKALEEYRAWERRNHPKMDLNHFFENALGGWSCRAFLVR